MFILAKHEVDGDVFYTVQMWTACCKYKLIVKQLTPTTFFNMIRGEPCTQGMNESMLSAIQLWNEKQTKPV
jgi:hypothetical protein